MSNTNYILLNNEHTFTLVKWSAKNFTNDPVLYLQTDNLSSVKEKFKDIQVIQVYQNDVSVGIYTVYDSYSDISYEGQVLNESINQFVDCLAVRLTKTSLAEQVQKLQNEINPVYDFDNMTIAALKEYKKNELNTACTENINKGVQIETDKGTETFSLYTHDQNNIASLYSLIMQDYGITELPYHSDGNECRMFPSLVIVNLYLQMQLKITQETTKCNLLRLQLEAETERDAIIGYTYDTELTDEHAAQYDTIVSNTIIIIEEFIKKYQEEIKNGEEDSKEDV